MKFVLIYNIAIDNTICILWLMRESIIMTDSKKLDLILQKIVGVETDISSLKEDVTGLKEDVTGLKGDVADLKEDVKRLDRNDKLILDEVERVHEILTRHINDKSKHTA